MQIADSQLPTLPPLRSPLVPERSDFLEGDAPVDKVQAFLARALEAIGADADITAWALVPWICAATPRLATPREVC